VSNGRQARELAWRFFLRDLRADFRQSFLGYFWLVIPPLGNTLVWVFLNDQNVVQIDSGAVPYPVFVLTGSILWNAFNGAVMAMLGVVGAARGLVSKVNFPQESLVYAAFMKSALDAFIPVVLLFPTALFIGLNPSWAILLFPLAFFACLAAGGALGLLTLPFGSLYSDIGRGVQFALRFGFFVTPVIYRLPPDGLARKLMLINPVSPLIATGRDWLTGSGEAMPAAFFGVLIGSFLLAYASLVAFKVAMPLIVERIGG
jgi:lipopolysaccharide transport system permease protein